MFTNFNYSMNIPAGGASAVSPAIEGNSPPFSGIHPNLAGYVDAPALTVTQLPNGQTITYALVESNNVDLSSPISTTTMGVQTGAAGAGAPVALFAARLAYAGGKYFGMKITASSTAASSLVSVIFKQAAL